MSDPFVGYTRIPDGLWYSDLSHGAVRVLGWMWSNPDTDVAFRAEVVREVFGPNTNTLLAELTMAGYIDPRETSGSRLSYWLVPKAWEALA